MALRQSRARSARFVAMRIEVADLWDWLTPLNERKTLLDDKTVWVIMTNALGGPSEREWRPNQARIPLGSKRMATLMVHKLSTWDSPPNKGTKCSTGRKLLEQNAASRRRTRNRAYGNDRWNNERSMKRILSVAVGKVDAGVAVLLTEDKRLIEFPSILLPPSITSGSIVDITVARNPGLEQAHQKSFSALQTSIFQTYGLRSPSPPVLRLRNATQTSIVLEWDSLDLATATLRSLSLYRNGAKAGVIPRYSKDGEEVLATKVSGLAIDTEYTFLLRLVTSAGSYASERLVCRTHKMTDLTGITVTPGPLPSPLRTSLTSAVERIGAKIVEGVRIDTTHFVCTEGRGREWERAVEMNIPVVRPEWVEGCEREGRIVGVRGYYLGADPKLRQVGPGAGLRGQQSGPQNSRAQVGRGDSQHAPPTREAPSQQAEPPTPSQPAVSGSQRPSETSPRPSTSAGAPDAPPPRPPAKDTPHLESPSPPSTPENDEDDGVTEEKEGEEEEEGDEPSEPVSPEEEGPSGDPKPLTPGVSEQGNFSEVQL
ncbi:MAG: hypothetical protein Q9163_006340 [Psora crenata]